MLKHLVVLDWCTNRYRRRACDECSRLVGLDSITILYQARDLSRNQPSTAFTNHYRRRQGLGRDLSVGEVAHIITHYNGGGP